MNFRIVLAAASLVPAVFVSPAQAQQRVVAIKDAG